VHHAYLIGAVNIALTILTTWSDRWYDPRTCPQDGPKFRGQRGCCHFCWQVGRLPTCSLRLTYGQRPKDQNPARPMVVGSAVVVIGFDPAGSWMTTRLPAAAGQGRRGEQSPSDQW